MTGKYIIVGLILLIYFVISLLQNMFGLRSGMMFLYVTLGYILSIGFWAKPLISNETIRDKRKVAEGWSAAD